MKDVRSSDVSSGRGFQVSAACAHHKRCFAWPAVTVSEKERKKKASVAERKVWAIEDEKLAASPEVVPRRCWSWPQPSTSSLCLVIVGSRARVLS